MSKGYFTPVDLDSAFPAPEPEATIPSRNPESERAKAESIVYVQQTISEELGRVRTGTSAYVPSAQQFTENKTPFCIALGQLTLKATPVDALKVVALARQDFGDRFANFVLEQFKPIFGDK